MCVTMPRIWDAGDRELERVFMASTLGEAQRAEELLTQRGVTKLDRDVALKGRGESA